MESTLTDTALAKQAKRFSDSIDHATYTLNGASQTVAIFNKVTDGPIVKIFLHIDDAVTGTIANIQLIDTDGDVAAANARTIVKPGNRGLYLVFKYQFTEQEVDSIGS